MNITFERYKDKYGGRVKFALLPFAVSQELKAALHSLNQSGTGRHGLFKTNPML